jgi:TolA-binding protein
VDFFAKFGEREAAEKRHAEAHYVMGLGYLGKGDLVEAGEAFESALKLNPNHLWAGIRIP